ncbi:acyltransferase family protein [Hellea balneolensis]|uniref:acyltransferase family protein n=1 Tax=Hellea balneolensis TaxID=287478 RepID=UPI000424C1DA|nr:acyltransferase [Hellea balneolensis]
MTACIKLKPYGQSQYFAALDGFRGLLALFVAIYHTIWFSHINSLTFFNNGAVIIDLFFALSGFLMFYLYDGKFNNDSDAKAFIKKRFARLYPLHLFMFVIFFGFAILRLWAHKVGIASHEMGEILPFTAGAKEGWGSLLSHLTLTHAIGLNNSLTFNPPAWTISAEFFTYFAFLAIMLWARPKSLLNFLTLGAIALAIYAMLYQLKPNMDITYDYAVLRCMAGFFIGMIAAKAYRELKPKVQVMTSKTRIYTFSILEVGIILASTLFIIFCGGKFQFFVAPFLLAFILIFAFDGGIISRFMSRKVFRYLAKISYSTYMTHVIISIAFSILGNTVLSHFSQNWDAGWGGDLWLMIYLCVVIGVSHLTYHYVEVPGSKLVRELKSPSSAKPLTKSV